MSINLLKINSQIKSRNRTSGMASFNVDPELISSSDPATEEVGYHSEAIFIGAIGVANQFRAR